MALVDGRILLAAIANGQLASAIAQQASLSMKNAKENIDETALIMGPSLKTGHKIPKARMSMDDESSDEEEMFELRRKAKQNSQTVVSHRGLPIDSVRETRQRE